MNRDIYPYSSKIVFAVFAIFRYVPLSMFVYNHFERIQNYDFIIQSSFIDLWKQIMYLTDGFVPIVVFAPVWVVLYSSSRLLSECNTGFLIYEIQRKSFKNLMLGKLIIVWVKSPLMLISFSLITILVVVVLPFEPSGSGSLNIQDPTAYILFSNLNILLYCILISNIGLLVNYRVKNLLVTVAISQVVFTMTQVIFTLIGIQIDSVLGGHNYENTLDLYNTLTLSQVKHYFLSSVFLIACNMITVLIVLRLYTNKEKMVMNFES